MSVSKVKELRVIQMKRQNNSKKTRPEATSWYLCFHFRKSTKSHLKSYNLITIYSKYIIQKVLHVALVMSELSLIEWQNAITLTNWWNQQCLLLTAARFKGCHSRPSASTSSYHVLLHYMHESFLWSSSSFPPFVQYIHYPCSPQFQTISAFSLHLCRQTAQSELKLWCTQF